MIIAVNLSEPCAPDLPRLLERRAGNIRNVFPKLFFQLRLPNKLKYHLRLDLDRLGSDQVLEDLQNKNSKKNLSFSLDFFKIYLNRSISTEANEVLCNLILPNESCNKQFY